MYHTFIYTINVHHTHYYTHCINVHHTHFINVHHTHLLMYIILTINVLMSYLLIILGLLPVTVTVFVLINLLSIVYCLQKYIH